MAEQHYIQYSAEIDGVDITRYLLPRPNLSISKSRDYPDFSVFNVSGINLPLINTNSIFDPGLTPNFFTRQGRDASGHGARLLITVTRDTTEQLHITGEVAVVEQSSESSLVGLVIRDISLRLRRSKIEGFGQQVTRRITDYPNANADYEVSQFHFRFPEGLTPILRSSVTASILVNDVSQPIEIVEAFTPSGTFSYQRATIDYENSVLQLEAMPPDGNSSVIDATWRISHRYKRPDFIVREIMGDVLFQTLPDYAIESIIFDSTTDTFSSNGRPFLQENGVVRWLKRNETDQSIWMAHQNALIKYDETADTYTKVATTPDDTAITETPPGGYGSERHDARIRVPSQSLRESSLSFNYNTVFTRIKVKGDRLYALETSLYTTRRIYASGTRRLALSQTISVFSTNPIATRLTPAYYVARNIWHNIPLSGSGGSNDRPDETSQQSYTRRRIRVWDFDIYDNHLYSAEGVNAQVDTGETGFIRIQKYPLANLDEQETTQNRESVPGEETVVIIPSGVNFSALAVTQTRIITAGDRVHFFSHAGVHLSSEDFPIMGEDSDGNPVGFGTRTIAVGGSYIYALQDTTRTVYAYNMQGVRQPFLDFKLNEDQYYENMAIDNNILYALRYNSHLYLYGRRNTLNAIPENSFVDSYSLINILNYHNFTIFNFDTTDFNNFYCLTTNTAKGDITQDSAFNSNRVSRYVRSTNTWTTLIDSTSGLPQVGEHFDLISQGQIFADNRKGFQVVRYNNIDYIFYRRVTSSLTQLAFFNTSNSLIGTVQSFSTTTSTNQGRQWSTDFIMETQSDNTVWSYFFMVNYNLSGSVYGGGHLQIIARRVFPSFLASSRFHLETFATTLTTYPTSVSSVALANDKLYFVLDYQAESATMAGKSELCVIPKTGGTRTVLKTYANPLLAARSPCVKGTSVYYLEGGSVRRTGSETVTDLYDYPDAGGHLIEVKADNTIVDYGIVWRSANVLDSPNPETPDRRYNGWGLHNNITSNMVLGDGDTLNFVAGFGNPFRTAENLPTTNPVVLDGDLGNFTWLQWGKKLSTKIESANLEGSDYWTACTQMATLTDAEIGFSPRPHQVSDYITANPTADVWEAWSTIFMRRRAVGTGQLSQALASGATPTTLVLSNTNLQTFNATGGIVVVDQEVISYTSATSALDNVTLAGVTRASSGSVSATHAINTRVYPVKIVIRDSNTSLVAVASRRVDISNLYNTISITYADGSIRRSDSTSQTEFGEIVLSLSAPFLNTLSLPWLEILANRYLARFKSFRNLVDASVPLDPTIELGHVIVLKTDRGFVSDYDTFEVMRVTHSLQNYQTALLLRQLS